MTCLEPGQSLLVTFGDFWLGNLGIEPTDFVFAELADQKQLSEQGTGKRQCS